ncbi:hypothetical protein CAOG_08277 [Capsaspora owczarzaki ATCC 30864]|uniref:hypothetical protein n=1 Tax=Capsaspora owczarzaki (strain ATCC 30864) TaxID=595528 RepID=UPI0001FE6416|nr:hypothetical protein CAOG_08277 [Capsaspora owczarzaki ATCC 30864]|eukprot:XP_004342393.1 hypothetical protein CAOG_08277 [Capsaspora owczarzaki ATCC 30864]
MKPAAGVLSTLCFRAAGIKLAEATPIVANNATTDQRSFFSAHRTLDIGVAVSAPSAQPPLKRIHDWLQVWLTLQTDVAIASAVCPLTRGWNGTKLAMPRAASNSKALHHDSMAFEYV